MKQTTIEGLTCQLFRASSQVICYIISPFELNDQWLEAEAMSLKTNFAVISGMEWDDDLTPWPAPGQPPGSPAFKGLAPEFLSKLTEEVVPQIDSLLGVTSPSRRILIGTSLSGLFTLWAWLHTDMFHDIASISGSFWYEGFVAWLRTTDIPHRDGLAYFSLGNREQFSKVKAFQPVATDTAAVIALLRKAGIRAVFQSVPGTHFAPFYPRLKSALEHLFP